LSLTTFAVINNNENPIFLSRMIIIFRKNHCLVWIVLSRKYDWKIFFRKCGEKTFTVNAEDSYDMINFVQPKLHDIDLHNIDIYIFNRMMSLVIQLIKQLLYCTLNFLIMSFLKERSIGHKIYNLTLLFFFKKRLYQ